MIKISKLMEFMIYTFVISSLLIPAAIINKIVFIIILFLYSIQLTEVKKRNFATLSPIFISMIYFYGYLRSFTSNSDSGLAFQFMVFATILFLIYPMLNNKINVDSLIKTSGLVLTLATFLLYMIFVKNISFWGSNQIFKIFYDYGLIAMGYRGFFGTDRLFVHFGTAPFLFLPGCLYFKDFINKKKPRTLFIIILIFIAMHLSTSRALILGFILAASILLMNKTKGYLKICTISAVTMLILISFTYLIFNSTIFDFNDVGNSIKIGDGKSFIENLTFKNIFLGEGLASYYYAGGRKSYTSHTENTLLDTIRYLGFFLTVLLYCFILIPSSNLVKIRNNKDNLFIFLIYLAMSLTNPILFNSLGGFIILWYWMNILKSEAQ